MGEDGEVTGGASASETSTGAVAKAHARDPATNNIEAFFDAIGEGVRAAQVNLDLQSAAYMQNKHPFAPETMFRLPRVSANLRLGMRFEKRKGFDFFVFENTEEKTQFSEQEISFEIAAVHPPPDALAATAELPLGRVIASSIEDRARAHERLKSERTRQVRIAKKAEQEGGADERARRFVAGANALSKQADFRRVLVLHGNDKLVLVKVPEASERTPEKPDIGVIILSLPMESNSESPVEATAITRTDVRSRTLFEALAQVADLQASLLTSLGRK